MLEQLLDHPELPLKDVMQFSPSSSLEQTHSHIRQNMNIVFRNVLPLSTLTDLFFKLHPTKSLTGHDTANFFFDPDYDFLTMFVNTINRPAAQVVRAIKEDSGEPNSGVVFEYYRRYIMPSMLRHLPAHSKDLNTLNSLIRDAESTAYAWSNVDLVDEDSPRFAAVLQRAELASQRISQKVVAFEKWDNVRKAMLNLIRARLLHIFGMM